MLVVENGPWWNLMSLFLTDSFSPNTECQKFNRLVPSPGSIVQSLLETEGL